MKIKLLTLIFSCSLSLFCWAQNFDKAKLDRYFDALDKNQKLMASVAVSQDGKLLYTRTIGYSDFENKIKTNENSKYRIGSISKTFTAVLVLKAVEDKKLDLDQNINSFFPSIKNAEKISIRQLLIHQSGIHNFTDDLDYLNWNTQPKSEKEMIEIIKNAGSDFEPGSKSNYSNSNYLLLSFILEKVYKKPYSELLQKYIIQPLDLKNTSFGGKIDVSKNECLSYSFNQTWQKEAETDMSIPIGAGGIISTPTDLTKFSHALFNGKLLKKESLEQMKTVVNEFGMGLFEIPFYDQIGLGHTGGIDGFRSVFSYFPDSKITYALTTNASNMNTNDVSIAVLSMVNNKDFEIPSFQTYLLNEQDLEKYLGVYSSNEIPLKITITKDKNTLIAQATGQSSFQLDPTEKDIFVFTMSGIRMEFNPTEKTMILKQGGGKFLFKKE